VFRMLGARPSAVHRQLIKRAINALLDNATADNLTVVTMAS
jgi:hypothetical protein